MEHVRQQQKVTFRSYESISASPQSGADCGRAFGARPEGNGTQNNGYCFEALLSAWGRGFPSGIAVGHAQAADERAEVPERPNEGGSGQTDGTELEKEQ